MRTAISMTAVVALLLCVSRVDHVRAQGFPSQPVKIVVPYPPGGGVDGLARPLAEALAQSWGKPVLVDNKPGASTIIGTEAVVKSAADGHTLLLTSDSTITSNPHLFKTLSYDPLKDLVPVTQLINLVQLVVVHPSVSAGSMQALVAEAKEKSNGLNYASYGVGSQPHLLFEMLKKETGISIEQIPFKGIAPAITAVVAGETQMTLAGASLVGGHMKVGKLKALAVASAVRPAAHPDVPTLREAGFPDIDPKSWFGVFAPAGTPPAVVEKVQAAIAAVFALPEFRARYIEGAGNAGVAKSAADFAAFIADDMAYKKRLITVTGITAE